MDYIPKLKRAAAFLSISFILAACTPEQQPVYVIPSASNTQYFCDQNRQIVVSTGVNEPAAAVLFQGDTINLKRISQQPDIFTNGTYTLFINGDGVVGLERAGIPVLTNCTVFQPEVKQRSWIDKAWRG